MTDNRTTELREKLDKLGIKHLDSDLPYNKQTRWNRGAGGWGACYVEITHGSILPADSIIDNCTLRIYDCTPEQAIAATLGSELNPDGLPVGLTISEDGELLNWRGENYVKQSTLGSGNADTDDALALLDEIRDLLEIV